MTDSQIPNGQAPVRPAAPAAARSRQSWVLAGRTLSSRLIVGTGGVQSLDVLKRVLRASGTALSTVAMRRVGPAGPGSLLGVLQHAGVHVVPNTAGCHTASEALFTARLGREALGTDWVKLEVVADDQTLLPDPVELLEAAGIHLGNATEIADLLYPYHDSGVDLLTIANFSGFVGGQPRQAATKDQFVELTHLLATHVAQTESTV